MWKLLALALLTVGLAACGGTVKPASVSGGECKIFRANTKPVKGADAYTEEFLDDTIEAGVVGCGWKRVRRAS